MIVLDQLASHIASETSMQVNEAVLLLSGIFFCDLHSSPDRDGTFYTVPRNFAEPLLSIITSTPSRKRKW